MKKLIAWSVYFAIVTSLMAQGGSDAANKKSEATAPPADTSIALVIYLSDGSRVVGTPTIERLKIMTKYATMEFQLSKVHMIVLSGVNHATQVNLQNGDTLHGHLDASQITVKTNSGDVVVPVAKVSHIMIRARSIGGDFVNSLGMEFMPVPGTKVLFGIWDTRVQDYRAYAKANPEVDKSWQSFRWGLKQGEDHPVVNVSWEEAKAFCEWLTAKERKEEQIGPNDGYRLPSDHEWSCAVGIGDQEEADATPHSKDDRIAGVYPWGKELPPPKGAGNYADEALKKVKSYFPIIDGYDDEYAGTSPVGSFRANQYGLYDMGGNVWQWCEDWYDATKKHRVIRGASWYDHDPPYLLSSSRNYYTPDTRDDGVGFRCVLVFGLEE